MQHGKSASEHEAGFCHRLDVLARFCPVPEVTDFLDLVRQLIG